MVVAELLGYMQWIEGVDAVRLADLVIVPYGPSAQDGARAAARQASQISAIARGVPSGMGFYS